MLLLAALIASAAVSAKAQDKDVPYWVSLRVDEVNMRVGPAKSYKIDWVYRREGLPLKVVRLQEGWRLVEDAGGTRGWMLADFLSRDRSAIVTGTGYAAMRAGASENSALRWRLEAGVSGRLGACEAGWCEFAVGKRKGFVSSDRLWGAGEP